ncbi:sugar-binding protein [Sorangium cellulosum]|jgi:ribose transport system substrate-binding protein|uniref:Sugar-binding protein n=1 Tax=Sorangium cellulosum TaxID=56 RepID=A0A4P2PWA2_SORCE|nr:substrate-binding domain-containing protein [Sorangium cellulosum]AUX20960.1 sugar-binding protein [Sorangium cellulosum]
MRYRAVSGSIILATGVLACGGDEAKTVDPVAIAYITHSECNRFHDLARAGARQARTELLATSERPVEVTILEPACVELADDGTTGSDDPCFASRPQMKVLQEVIDRKVDAIVIDVFDGVCERDLVDQAVDAGIKVVTYGGDAPASKRHTYYGMDNRAAAAFLMDALATLNGKTGKIALQTMMEDDGEGAYSPTAAGTFVDRLAGFSDALKKYPDMTNVATLPCLCCDYKDPFCTQQAEAALQDDPEIAGFFFSYSKLLGEPDLEANAPLFTERAKEKKIHSVAFDALPEYFDRMRAGYVDVLLGQKVFGWGYDTVLLAYDMVTIHRQVNDFTDAGWYVVCPNNLDEFERNTRAMDYRTPLPACSLLP